MNNLILFSMLLIALSACTKGAWHSGASGTLAEMSQITRSALGIPSVIQGPLSLEE